MEDGITGNGVVGGAQYVSNDYVKYDDYDNGSQMDLYPYTAPTSSSGDCLESLAWDSVHPFLVQPLTTRYDNRYVTGFCDYISTNNKAISYRGTQDRARNYEGVSCFYRGEASFADITTGCRLMKEITSTSSSDSNENNYVDLGDSTIGENDDDFDDEIWL